MLKSVLKVINGRDLSYSSPRIEQDCESVDMNENNAERNDTKKWHKFSNHSTWRCPQWKEKYGYTSLRCTSCNWPWPETETIHRRKTDLMLYLGKSSTVIYQKEAASISWEHWCHCRSNHGHQYKLGYMPWKDCKRKMFRRLCNELFPRQLNWPWRRKQFNRVSLSSPWAPSKIRLAWTQIDLVFLLTCLQLGKLWQVHQHATQHWWMRKLKRTKRKVFCLLTSARWSTDVLQKALDCF